MSTLIHLERQIAALQQKAAEIRKREAVGVIAKIKDAIEHYQLQPEDLFGKPARRQAHKARPAAFKPNKGKGPAKYHDGNGNAWSGMGKRPAWFKDRIAAGHAAESMLVQ